MRAHLLLIAAAVSLCLTQAKPGRRRAPNDHAERRQGPSGGTSDLNNRQPEDDDNGALGFYRGPPEGFPSFDHLFGTPSQSFGSPSASPHSSREQPFFQREEEERYRGGSEEEAYPAVPVLRPSYPSGGPSSFEEEDGGRYAPTGPSSASPYGGSGEEPQRRRPFASAEESFPPHHTRQSPQSYEEEEEAPQRTAPPAYVHSHSKEPVVLKVGSLGRLPGGGGAGPSGGPSVFYAPSPDIQTKGRHRGQTHPRYRRSLPNANANANVNVNATTEDPMTADGSTQSKSTLYWPSSPFISFDHYKESSLEDDVSSNSNARSDDVNANSSSAFHDSTSEEQRFFPSFPSPYLSPFSSRPHLNSPLNFPGPSSNHRPSRYPSSPPSSPPILPFSKFPSRGPSSAASHDARYTDTNILGSGNFEVVRGGTYYGDEGAGGGGGGGGGASYGGGHHGGGGGGGGAYHSDSEDDYYSPPVNGHSSPYRGGSGGGGDFFANFRDFADINPHSRSFSHQSPQVLEAEEEEEETPEASSHSTSRTLRRTSRPSFSMDYDPMVATF